MRTALAHDILNTEPSNDVGESVGDVENVVTTYMAQLRTGPSRFTTLCRLRRAVRYWSKGAHLDPYSFEWDKLTLGQTIAYKEHLTKTVKFNTCNAELAAIRKIIDISYKLGQMSPAKYRTFHLLTKIKGESGEAGRMLTQDELTKLVSAPKSRMNRRRVALILLLYGCGLRISEALSLAISRFSKKENRVCVTVNGKGNKVREVPVPSSIEDFLISFAGDVQNENAIDNIADPFLFPSNRNARKPMTQHAARLDLQKFARGVGVEHFTPHDMRRTYISELFGQGADVAVISKLVGHAHITQTVKYDRRGLSPRIATVDKLPIARAVF